MGNGQMVNIILSFIQILLFRGAQELRSLLAIPFVNWKKAKQILDSHSGADYELKKFKGLRQL